MRWGCGARRCRSSFICMQRGATVLGFGQSKVRQQRVGRAGLRNGWLAADCWRETAELNRLKRLKELNGQGEMTREVGTTAFYGRLPHWGTLSDRERLKA